MMKSKIFLKFSVILIFLLTGNVGVFCAEKFEDDFVLRRRLGKTKREEKVYSVEEFKNTEVSFGTYHVKGYVVKKYTCLSCPKGAMCKPCMEDNIVISDDSKRLKNYDLTVDQLILFIDDVKKLKLGKKYRFLIQIKNVRSVDEDFNNAKVIYFERI